MSDSDLAPPKEPKISEMIVGYVYLQVALFVAIVYGMKNMELWPYGVDRCEIVKFLFIAGFLITTLLVLMNNAESRAEKIITRNRIGRTRTMAGRVVFLPAILFGIYFIGLHGLPQFCEKFFSGSDGFKSVIEAKNLILSFMAVCSLPALLFFLVL